MSIWQKDTRFTLAGPAGELEVATVVPSAAQAVVALICHPDPQGGGTMDNKVVTTVARALRDLGVPSLRFNYRGVGASEGTSDQGVGETEDCLFLLRWLREQQPAVQLWLCGFSFGAYVALSAQQSQPVDLMLSIAPAVTLRPFTTLKPPSCPWFIVQGELDEVVDPQSVYAFAAQHAQAAELIRMPAAGHFFHGQLIELRNILSGKLSPFLNENYSQ